MKKAKPFLSIDDQINLLKERQLNIPDEDLGKTRDFFLNNNYYRVSGYTLTLRKNDIFYEQANINNIIQIYNFDKLFRHIILTLTEEIEVRIRSMIAYYHTEKYGPLGYEDINSFDCMKGDKINSEAVDQYLFLKRKANKQKDNMSETEAYLKHHRDERNGIIPFWVFVEVLTISDVSKLYNLLDIEIKKQIAKRLGFTHKTASDLVSNLLHSVAIVRNICAHGGRLYNRVFIRKPRLSKKQKELLMKDENDEIIFDRLFSYILILKSLSLPEDFNILKEHLLMYSNKYSFIDMKYYGFPNNWNEIL